MKIQKITQKIKYMLALAALTFSFSGLFFSTPASAALFDGAKSEACAGVQLNAGAGTDCTPAAADSLGETVRKGINFLTIIVGIICVMMLIIGGLRFVLSNGDSSKVNSARDTIIYALVGLIIVAFAQIIVKFVLTKV